MCHGWALNTFKEENQKENQGCIKCSKTYTPLRRVRSRPPISVLKGDRNRARTGWHLIWLFPYSPFQGRRMIDPTPRWGASGPRLTSCTETVLDLEWISEVKNFTVWGKMLRIKFCPLSRSTFALLLSEAKGQMGSLMLLLSDSWGTRGAVSLESVFLIYSALLMISFVRLDSFKVSELRRKGRKYYSFGFSAGRRHVGETVMRGVFFLLILIASFNLDLYNQNIMHSYFVSNTSCFTSYCYLLVCVQHLF